MFCMYVVNLNITTFFVLGYTLVIYTLMLDTIFRISTDMPYSPSFSCNMMSSPFVVNINTVLVSDWFETFQGVGQGCNYNSHGWCYKELAASLTKEIAFVDNILLIANSAENLLFNLKVWYEKLCKVRMKVNIQKTRQ